MAAPTFADIMEQMAFFFDACDELEKDTAAATTGWVDILANAIADFNGDTVAAGAAVLDDMRAAAADALDPGLIAAYWEARAPDVAQAINKPFVDASQTWEDLYDYMVTNDEDVNSRDLTFGSPSAGGSNVGNGRFLRLTVDENGLDLEGWRTDTYTATVTRDSNQQGVQFEEIWKLEGTDAAPDELQYKGSGLSIEIRSQSERDSEALVTNPSFENVSPTPATSSESTPTSLTGWTPTSAFSNFASSVDVVYRTLPGSSTSRSIRFLDNDTLSQDLIDVRGARFDPNKPYYLGVPVYREGSCDGTLTITLGAVSRAVTMSTLSNGAWTVVDLVSTPGANNWFANINQADMTLSFQLASRTTGTLYLDGLQLFPWLRVGSDTDAREGRGAMGTYVLPISGTTPFEVDDTFTMTDSESARGVNNYWAAVGGLGYLRHISDTTETIADK